ncbi:MAG: two-component system chemotaxis response regulator CheB [Chlamydiales bacterium]
MASPIKVLAVDDAIVIRKLIQKRLSEDPEIDVIDVAANGRIALRKIEELDPELVVLDLEMPIMDGIETLREIRRTRPKLPVIIFSGQTNADASLVNEALALGATAALVKPSSGLTQAAGTCVIRETLAPIIKSICRGWKPRPKSLVPAKPNLAPVKAARRPRARSVENIGIVAIGSSTGGPNALTEVISSLPKDLPVPVVVVQHMPAVFTRHLAERLDSSCALDVFEGQPGAELYAGGVWIAPGGYHMVLQRKRAKVILSMNTGPMENSCRPAVDPMFRSVASLYGETALSVILTGMGTDGLKGCEEIHAVGGRILIQDEETSVVWGMPGAVSEAGLADREVPLGEIGPTIARWCQRKRARTGTSGADESTS